MRKHSLQQFKIDPHLVEDLRASKQGWGEITIRLVLAQEAYKLAPSSYPNLVQPLQRIGDLRKEKQSWGEIAKQLGVDLLGGNRGQRVHQELRAQGENKCRRRRSSRTWSGEWNTRSAKLVTRGASTDVGSGQTTLPGGSLCRHERLLSCVSVTSSKIRA